MHRSRSFAKFRSPKLSLPSEHHNDNPRQPAGQSWSERRRAYVEPLGSRFRTYLGTPGPKARADRVNWLHGAPDEMPSIGRCRGLQVAAQNF